MSLMKECSKVETLLRIFVFGDELLLDHARHVQLHLHDLLQQELHYLVLVVVVLLVDLFKLNGAPLLHPIDFLPFLPQLHTRESSTGG